MKKVLVSMQAITYYSVEVEVADDATDEMLLDAAESIADHATDVVAFKWQRRGSWHSGDSPAYDIEEIEDYSNVVWSLL